MASTVQYVISAVQDVLTAGHGNARTLASADRFRVGLRPGETPGQSSLEAHVQKRCWAEITSQSARGGTQELGNVASYDLTVEVALSYFTGAPEVHSELRASFLEAASDYHKIRGALCYPGNLSTDASANATGLAGGALIALGGGWSKQTFDADARALKVTASFSAIVHLSQ